MLSTAKTLENISFSEVFLRVIFVILIRVWRSLIFGAHEIRSLIFGAHEITFSDFLQRIAVFCIQHRPAFCRKLVAERVSIARCILKDAPIVILDEATASVDLDNERHIQEAITELVRGKTLLVIAHRLNTIRVADKIVVVSEGKIAEQGTHDQLLKRGGIYNNFIHLRGRQRLAENI